ncbi:BZ3500_MvSof-1268-A1-R1_Chr2-1g04564 [Microbotryum saponariae]|uniref:BZ3500_MvSof-1268-A1-R1_Chr2-1g04564 protein n=1 Tax=Microbotryum saponariae TaxID=289078 RepID=A0A2X0MBZ0_9BASI|nr:BZ3500_MvSof-1268-A1-R1_Chr2-1g04564 [Microbotryum saponariae]
MKNIRRSLNKERIGAPTPTYSSLPTASFPASGPAAVAVVRGGASSPAPAANATTPAVAPTPPKRVIRAVESYRARSSQELSFEAGDFFHVVSDEGGDEWFDAANPLTGARGLVPASHFQVLGRNVRENATPGHQVKKSGSGSNSGSGSSFSNGPPLPASTSGSYSSSSQPGSSRVMSVNNGYVASPVSTSHMSASASAPPQQQPQHQQLQQQQQQRSSGSARPPSQPAPKQQPLYGIVQYDFVAERADELDAKRGEPIIVIAQSNHEWFVAKPIGRLGGPGLIPVAFVEIQDMTTGKPVENVEELIRSAVVPKVEEWKKMTADYKSASIPLGRFDFGGSNGGDNSVQSSAAPSPAPNAASFEGTSQAGASSSRAYEESDNRTPQHAHQQRFQEDPAPQKAETGYEGDERRYSYTKERKQYGLVTSASVESFHQEEGSFWFHLRVFFSTGASLVLYRLYQDFYDFQIALMDEFPVEAGRVPAPGDPSGRLAERILPMMPGPTDYEDEVVCAQRVHDLSVYLHDLCQLPGHIRTSGLMYEFLVPRAGDVEVSAGNGRGNEPGGGASNSIEGQYGELVEYLDQMDGGAAPNGSAGLKRSGVESDLARLDLNGAQNEPRSHSSRSNRSSGSQQASFQQAYYTNPSSQPPASPLANASSLAPHLAPMGNAHQGAAFIKIKIFHRNTDDLIAIRVPPTVTHGALLDKVRERLGNDVVNLRYREEVGSETSSPVPGAVVMAGGARLVGLETDDELERWVRSGSRLVLYAD